jgi:GT2 family glycosyltransferase
MIYIVIPNYNGLEHLETCFESVFRQSYKDFKVIFVDNGSADDSVKFTEQKYPTVSIIKKDFNTGFSVAVNLGIKKALEDKNCEYILLLNNDVECADNFFEEIIKGFTDESIGSVACKMLNFFNRNKIDDTGNFIKLIGSPYRRGSEETDTGQYDRAGYVFGACGGAAIFKRGIFENIGLFDEDFFAYYEDVDFSFRMQLAGYKSFYNPKAVCYHKRGATTGYISAFQTKLCEKNLIALRIKNYPLGLYLLLNPLFFLGRVIRIPGFLFTGKVKIFFGALYGYLSGLTEIPKSISKRREIRKLKKVNNKYIYSLFTK